MKVGVFFIILCLGEAHGCFPVALTDELLAGTVAIQTGDCLAGSVTAVPVHFSIGVVQDGPAIIVLHSLTVASVVDLTAAVELINRCTRSSQSTVTAIVSVVQHWPAVRYSAQDH